MHCKFFSSIKHPRKHCPTLLTKNKNKKRRYKLIHHEFVTSGKPDRLTFVREQKVTK